MLHGSVARRFSQCFDATQSLGELLCITDFESLGAMVNTYDKLRRDLKQVKEWRKVALSVAIDGPDPASDQSTKGAFSKRKTGEALSLEMEELVRAYTQFGHLTTASGHTLKKNPDLHLHNAGAW